MYLTQLVKFTVYDNLWRRCVCRVYFGWFMVVLKKGKKNNHLKRYSPCRILNCLIRGMPIKMETLLLMYAVLFWSSPLYQFVV